MNDNIINVNKATYIANKLKVLKIIDPRTGKEYNNTESEDTNYRNFYIGEIYSGDIYYYKTLKRALYKYLSNYYLFVHNDYSGYNKKYYANGSLIKIDKYINSLSEFKYFLFIEELKKNKEEVSKLFENCNIYS